MTTTYLRTWALDDIQISRAHADGRTVTAYAAIFDAPYEVVDQHGHYMEVIDRAAFNRTLSHGLGRTVCLYNHGMDLRGKPDAVASVPLGTPLEITPDGKGLLTVTRYNRSALADAALEAIRAGDIRSQSFRGRIFRSSPDRVPRVRAGQDLPTVTRHELGLADYGPTPIPVNNSEMVVAVRSMQQLAEEIEDLDDDERQALFAEMTRHLPGKHNQGAHGNRLNTPGDRSSGLRQEGKPRGEEPTEGATVGAETDPKDSLKVRPEAADRLRSAVDELFPAGGRTNASGSGVNWTSGQSVSAKQNARKWIQALETGDYRAANAASYQVLSDLDKLDPGRTATRRARDLVLQVQDTFNDRHSSLVGAKRSRDDFALFDDLPTADEQSGNSATSAQSEPGAEDPPRGHSGRLAIARARLRMELTQRGIRNAS